MNKRGKKILFLVVFGLTLFSGLILFKSKNFDFVQAQETLSCEVRSSACGDTKPVEVFRMQNTTNAHAGTPTGSSYTYRVCCGGITDLGNSCSGNYAVVLRLSSQTNAHVQKNTYGNYSYPVCLSAPSGNSISIAYRSGSCNADETTLASMSGPTNAHVASTAYTTKICAKVTGVNISVSVSDGVVSYGIMPTNTSKTTIDLNDTQTLTNDGNVTENFNIKGQNAPCPWTLASTPGTDQYVHEFCKTSEVSCASPPTNYTPLTTTYQTLYTGVAASSTRQLDLRITTPTSTNCFTQQSVDVTIQAVAY
ncbi:MAG: hypothetical protein ACP5HL_01925 [Minisyncoccia bacterium]